MPSLKVEAKPQQTALKPSNQLQQKCNELDLVDLIEQPEWKVILLELVKKEKMDLWAIDLVKLSQEYLKKIQQMQELSLRIPANAILACAILLKMKSKTIRFPFLEKKEQELSEEEIKKMNEMLPELTPLTKMRESTVTLNELLTAIEAVIEKTKQKPAGQRLKANEKPVFRIPVFSEKDISEKIEEVYSRILELADSQGLVLFSALIIDHSPLGIVDTFVPLLFLGKKGRISLWQESFFGEIFISLPQSCTNENA